MRLRRRASEPLTMVEEFDLAERRFAWVAITSTVVLIIAMVMFFT